MLFPLLRCSPFCFLILESCLVFGVFFALELLQVPPSMHSYNFCSRNAVLLTRPMHRQDGAPTRHITLKTRPTQRLLQSGKCSKVYSLLGLPLVQKCRYVLLGGFNCELVPCNQALVRMPEQDMEMFCRCKRNPGIQALLCQEGDVASERSRT